MCLQMLTIYDYGTKYTMYFVILLGIAGFNKEYIYMSLFPPLGEHVHVYNIYTIN